MNEDTFTMEHVLTAMRAVSNAPRVTWASSAVMFEPHNMILVRTDREQFTLGHPMAWARAFRAMPPRALDDPSSLVNVLTGGQVVDLDPPNPELPPLAGMRWSERARILEAVLPTLLEDEAIKARLIAAWRRDVSRETSTPEGAR